MNVEAEGIVDGKGEKGPQDVADRAEATKAAALARESARSDALRQGKMQYPLNTGTSTSPPTTNSVPSLLLPSPSFDPTTTDPSVPDLLHIRHLKRLEAEALRREEAADEKLKGLSIQPDSGRRNFQRRKRSSLGGGSGVGLDGWCDGNDDDDDASVFEVGGSGKTFDGELELFGEEMDGQERKGGDDDFDWGDDEDGETTVGPQDILVNLSGL